MENKKDLEKDNNTLSSDDVIDLLPEDINNDESNNDTLHNILPELIDESDTKLTPEDYEDILNNMKDHNKDSDKL